MRDKGFTYSYDMLGEAALTTADANKYFKDYLMAIEAVGRDTYVSSKSSPAPSVSIKLSALHPRYEVAFAWSGEETRRIIWPVICSK